MVKWGVEGVMFNILGRGNKKEENNLGSEKTTKTMSRSPASAAKD